CSVQTELLPSLASFLPHDLFGKPVPTFPDHSLPIAIGAIEIVGDIVADSALERREAGVIAGAAQVLDGALREILILAADRVRHLDIFDIGRPPESLEHGVDHVAEAFGFAGADIENAADRGGVE